MKRVVYKDGTGLFRCVLLRDEDNEQDPSVGIPVEPPPLEKIVPDFLFNLNNELVQRGLFTLRDIEQNDGALTGAILSSARRLIILAYKLKEQEENGNKQL